MKRAGKVLDEFFKRVLKPSREQMEISRRNVLDRLNSMELVGVESMHRQRKVHWQFRLAIAVAGVVIAIVGTTALLRTNRMMAEARSGTLYRALNGEAQAIQPGEEILGGDVIRSNGGGVFVLPDGSTVEMRSDSELSLDSLKDGVRIRLNRGGVVVHSAGKGVNNLYVETKDLLASVPGTVSLVNAEERGSRVAVVQGEVEVRRRGAKAQKLIAGEQVVTSSAMASLAPASLAVLRQAAVLLGSPNEKFEVTSIRLSAPPPQGTRGGGGVVKAGENTIPNEQPCFIPQRLQVNPGRITIERATLHGLIAAAYGVSCTLADAISGEPEWARSLRFDIQGVIPPGTSVNTAADLLEGNAPQLQRMLQNLLADRFKLALGRALKEMPGYDLVVARPGQWNCNLPVSCHGLRRSADQTPDGEAGLKDNEGFLPVATTLNLHTTVSNWTGVVSLNTGRPTIDKTGLRGFYDIRLEYPDLPDPAVDGRGRLQEVRRQRFPATIEEQLGFKLVPSTALVEVLTVQHVEKPSEN